MRIAVDAMGSDNAPFPEVEGAVEICSESDCNVILVGNEEEVTAALEPYPKLDNISVVHAAQAIGMHESPVLAIRKKRESSLLVAMRLVKEGGADAFVSAGNTGAVMVAARTILRPIKGVARSAICQRLPTLYDPVLLLDLGANVDCSARHICDFAEMGTVYVRHAYGVDKPRVGLLNIGEEQLKGNELARQVHRSLTAAPHIRFIGNIEPRAMYAGEADVVVSDGFVGNVVLKTSEAVASLMTQLVKRELKSTWTSSLGAMLSSGAFKRLKHIIDPNEHPGALLLGVTGVVFILHGSSSATGIANAIRGARTAVETEINEHIRRGIEELRNAEAHQRAKEQTT